MGRRKNKVGAPPAPRDPDTVRLCDCAGCGAALCGESERDWHAGLSAAERAGYPPLVAGRMYGRPYCPDCLRVSAPGTVPLRAAVAEDGAGPWADNAVRALEGD